MHGGKEALDLWRPVTAGLERRHLHVRTVGAVESIGVVVNELYALAEVRAALDDLLVNVVSAHLRTYEGGTLKEAVGAGPGG